MEGKLAPHEGIETSLLLADKKPVAMFEQSCVPEETELLIELGVLSCIEADIEMVTGHKMSKVLVFKEENRPQAEALITTLQMAYAKRPYNIEYDREIGRLLGYEEVDIEFFLNRQRLELAFETANTKVYFLNHAMLAAWQDYIVRNKAHLAPYEPVRDEAYFTKSAVMVRIAEAVNNRDNKRGVNLVFTAKDSRKIIGSVNFNNFVFGVFMACHLGYSIDKDHQGKGLMTEVLKSALPFIKQTYGLHRVMANYMPSNERSGYVLQKLGFEKEGYAKSYLKINGQWEDHVLTAYVFDNQ